ncbi:MAG: SoxR reducing system RseC family protein [Deferribacterales bacterium]
MSSMLKHKAVVLNIESDGTAVVEIARGSACSACGEKSSCTITDDTNIRLRFKNSSHLKAGDMVEIGIEKQSFFKGLFIVYIVPLILMLASAVITDSITDKQLITAGVTLAVLIMYFIGLKLLHNGEDKQSYRLL